MTNLSFNLAAQPFCDIRQEGHDVFIVTELEVIAFTIITLATLLLSLWCCFFSKSCAEDPHVGGDKLSGPGVKL